MTKRKGEYIKTPQGKGRTGVYLRCETCGDEFYVYPSQTKKAEARNGTIRFCSMKCYDKTGNNNPFWGKRHTDESIKKMTDNPNRPRFATGENNPNFIRFGGEFGYKGSRKDWQRNRLFDEIGVCEECGIDDKRLLTMHHIDRNPKNNTHENLMLLCWNCHALAHWENKDGFYHFMRRKND